MASPNSNSLLQVLPLILILLFSSPHPSSSAECNAADKKALLAIKQAWGNPYVLSSWNASTNCCDSWNGISCDTLGRVSNIYLVGDTSTRGTIPSAMGDLPFLRTLAFVSFPGLSGPLNPALARLTRLTLLALNSNGLSGAIPSFLGSMASLEAIDLSKNKFSGSLPPELSSLTKLRNLDLSHNRLTGSIPESFGKFPSELILNLGYNKLSSFVPGALGDVNFASLDISNNQLSGDASPLFRASITPFIREIIISNNKFQFDLTNVEFPLNSTHLDISNNKIFGSIPQQVSELQQLAILTVRYNQLCGQIPSGTFVKAKWYFEHNKCLCGTPLPRCR